MKRRTLTVLPKSFGQVASWQNCVCLNQLYICSIEHGANYRQNTIVSSTQTGSSNGHQARYTGEILLRTRPKTYRAIVRELAEPNASVNGISRRYRVSNHTVMGIREREAQSIAERKNQLISMLADVAIVGAERMSEKIGKASLRDAAIGTGIAVDKMLALTGQTPACR